MGMVLKHIPLEICMSVSGKTMNTMDKVHYAIFLVMSTSANFKII